MKKNNLTKKEMSLIKQALALCIRLNEIQDKYIYGFDYYLEFKITKWKQVGLKRTDISEDDLYHSDLYTDLRYGKLKRLVRKLKGEFKLYEGNRYSE